MNFVQNEYSVSEEIGVYYLGSVEVKDISSYPHRCRGWTSGKPERRLKVCSTPRDAGRLCDFPECSDEYRIDFLE